MILSMTGFAAVAAELPGLSVAVELRSVNHRYLDVTVKLPDELRALETALRERLAAALKRGKVECRVALARAASASAAMAVDPKRVSRARRRRVRSTARLCPARRRCPPPRSCAGRACWSSRPSTAETLVGAVHGLVDRALAELAAARGREGAKLADVLLAPLRRHRSAGRARRAAHSGDPRGLRREAGCAAARGRPRRRTRTA